MMDFAYETTRQTIRFGDGALGQLPQLCEAFGWDRLTLCTSPHWRAAGTVDAIHAALPASLVAVFDRAAAHVPESQVRELQSLVRQNGSQTLIAMGGGSVIGLAKAVSHALPPMPVIAIPTTYAGSEMTPIYGVTGEETDGTTRKVTQRAPEITPRAVLYDPRLTLDLPPSLTASSGVNALAHCIEAVYSPTANALSTAAALQGIRQISRALPLCMADGHDLAARSELLAGAHLAGVALATVRMGLHHGTGHVLGGTAGVPHGVANCIVLPHALRFNAAAVPAQLALVAEALGVARNGRSDSELALDAAAAVETLIAGLPVPQRLRDAGVPRALLPQLAQNLLLSQAVHDNPRPLATEEEALRFLLAMW